MQLDTGSIVGIHGDSSTIHGVGDAGCRFLDDDDDDESDGIEGCRDGDGG